MSEEVREALRVATQQAETTYATKTGQKKQESRESRGLWCLTLGCM